MNFLLLRNYFRLLSGNLALLCIKGSLFYLIALFLFGTYGFLFEDSWPTLGFVWAALSLVTLMVILADVNYRGIYVIVKTGHGLKELDHRRFTQAESFFREAWQCVDTFPADHPCRGAVLEHLALVTRVQGNYDDAESFGQQWFAVQENVWGTEHSKTIRAMEQLAGIYLDIARYSQAEALLEKSLQVREKNHEPITQDVARCLNSLGRLWYERGDAGKAEPYVRRAYDIVQRLNARDSRVGALIFNHLVDVCLALGKLEETKSMVESANELLLKSRLSQEAFAAVTHRLALIEYARKRFGSAEFLERRALEFEKLNAGPNSLGSSVLWCGLAQSLKAQEKWADAEECFRKALAICEQMRAPEHPEIAGVLECYADLLMRLGRFDEGQTLLHRAHQIREFHSPLRIV